MAIFSTIAYGIGYAVGFLGAAAGLSTATILTLAGVATNIAASAALSLVARALAPKVSVPQQEIQALISQTDAPRRVYVGQYLAGGIRALFDVKNGTLYQLVMVSHGRISEFVKFWIDGNPVNLDGSGNVTSSKKAGYVTCLTRDGSGLGGNYNGLTSNFTNWNASRKLTGQATFMARMKAPSAEDFSKIFPKAYNTSLQWVIRGQAVYDPRSNGSAYSDNAALVIAHYLTHEDGYRLDSDDVSWSSVSAMADVSDIPVPQLGGGTAPNLRLWGYWTLDENPVDFLSRMHTSSGIRAYEMQDGRIGLIGGPFGEPAMTLTAKDISDIKTTQAISEREGYNVLRVFHLSAAQKYEVIEVDPWKDAARLAIEDEIAKEYRLEMCPNLSQARRLAKQQISNDNRATIEVITNLVGLKARFPAASGQRHTIMVDYQPEDGSGRVIQGEYEVMDHEFDPVELQCRIKLARVSRDSEAWTAAEEGETIADLPTDEVSLAPQISATLTQRIIRVSASMRQAVLEVDAVQVADRTDISLQAQFRKIGSAQWIDMQSTDYSAQSSAVEDGESYEARARFNGVFDEVDTWEMLGPIAIQIDATAPGKPNDLIPSTGAGYVHLSWRNPSTPFFEIRIYRNSVNNSASAALVGKTGGAAGQISEFRDETIAGSTDYWYWVAAANVSGVEGSMAGPANVST